MNEELKSKIIWAMISFIDDSPIGLESLEGYWETDDIRADWEQFKEDN